MLLRTTDIAITLIQQLSLQALLSLLANISLQTNKYQVLLLK